MNSVTKRSLGSGVDRWMPPPGRVAARRRSAQSSMAYKKNANGRHHIPKRRHGVVIWRDYDAGLRRRGSLSLWLTDEAMAAWPFSSAGSMRDGPTPTGGRRPAARCNNAALSGGGRTGRLSSTRLGRARKTHESTLGRSRVGCSPAGGRRRAFAAALGAISGSETPRGESSWRVRRVTGQQLAPRPRCLAARTG